ncbi:alpha-L-fucosidase [Coraliomargarita algicola]|uniref:alpha-L-fucosidase n=1 Tax=Coraliomargarita algicola TaxID=3092156 RepID=A0ABZ0RQY5_9BACT|nr:alpha-L-fucosidase [Coraliomargarita sp. J2-16]WPJ95344.1 alpha-L-fucosidase [Coraliomargarita sp. J2-16]
MKLSVFTFLVALLASAVYAAEPKQNDYQTRFSPSVKQTPDSEARLNQWYRDAKYGAFIHFGVYSMLAGQYEGKVTKGSYSEWIRKNMRIVPQDYHAVAAEFNPSEFDADEWVHIFKESGMKYVVITAKHHDGFALYDSEVSDFNIVDHTPFKRDVIKELSEACQRVGLKFGVYYSHAKDWDEPYATGPLITKDLRNLHPDLPKDFKADQDTYFDRKSLPQVEELLTNYKVDLIWFDTPHAMTAARAKRFSDLVWRLNPDCLINSRILLKANDIVTVESVNYFDFGSLRDKEVPPTPPAPGAIYVESPDSVSSSYGYKAFGKHHYHSGNELVERLVHTVCNGGNYLLNNGPMGNGKIDPEAVRLYGIDGDWLKVNGESIYNTRPNPFGNRPGWGDISVSQDGKAVYLHIMTWPTSGSIRLEGLSLTAAAVSFLANGEKAEFSQQDGTLTVTLPAEPLNQYDTVLKMSLDDCR